VNESERKRMSEYRIQKALGDAESALFYLVQGEPLSIQHDAFARTALALVERIDAERRDAANIVPVDVGDFTT